MTSSLSALKRSNNLDTLMGELSKVAEPQRQTNSYQDDRFWKPELDKSGNGYAVFRFLPAVQDEDFPWARLWSHAFQGPGGWLIENSLTTLNQKCPISEANSLLWNSGVEADKDIARKRKRKLSYTANIMIISDPKHPENEGQVKLYKFGKKIFDKITEAMKPEFEDETPINPFDFWEGAHFKLKIRQVEGYRNYDKSEFASASALSSDESELEEIYGKLHDLTEFSDPKNYKSYDELKAKLNKVLGTSTMTSQAREELETMAPAVAPVSSPEPAFTAAVEPVTAEAMESTGTDDTMSYFARLAAED